MFLKNHLHLANAPFSAGVVFYFLRFLSSLLTNSGVERYTPGEHIYLLKVGFLDSYCSNSGIYLVYGGNGCTVTSR